MLKDKYIMKTDTCKCGEMKDHRAELCRKCTNIKRANLPCKGCGNEHPGFVFRKLQSGEIIQKRRGLCEKCDVERSKKYRGLYSKKIKQRRKDYNEKHKDRIRRSVVRNHWKKAGLNPDLVEAYLKTHVVCEICGQDNNGQPLYADHCHKTNTLRGALCKKCNFGIGQFNDDTTMLTKAIEYLKSHS